MAEVTLITPHVHTHTPQYPGDLSSATVNIKRLESNTSKRRLLPEPSGSLQVPFSPSSSLEAATCTVWVRVCESDTWDSGCSTHLQIHSHTQETLEPWIGSSGRQHRVQARLFLWLTEGRTCLASLYSRPYLVGWESRACMEADGRGVVPDDIGVWRPTPPLRYPAGT